VGSYALVDREGEILQGGHYSSSRAELKVSVSTEINLLVIVPATIKRMVPASQGINFNAPNRAKHPRFLLSCGNEADTFHDKGDTGDTLYPGGGEHLQYHPDLLVKVKVIDGDRENTNDQ
jgi:hypothetical protein